MSRLHFGNMVRVGYWCEEEDKAYISKLSREAKKKNPRMTDSEVFRQLVEFGQAKRFKVK